MNTSGQNTKLNPTHTFLPNRAHNVAQFCRNVGCTVQDYKRTTQSLKRLKMELSNKMLSVEDELDRIQHSRELENDTHHKIPNNIALDLPVSSLPLQSWLSSSLNALQNTYGTDIKNRIYNIINQAKQGTSEACSQNIAGGRSVVQLLLERRKALSDRALAIQNLLTTLQAMEETELILSPPTQALGTTNMDSALGESQPSSSNKKHGTRLETARITRNELAYRYRRIAREEGIKVTSMDTFNIRETQNEASVISYWKTLVTSQTKPKPPPFPPTMRQFMDQWNSDHISRTIIDSKSNEMVEDFTREWFGMTRITTYPVATSIPSRMSSQKVGKTRATTYPFSPNTNITSTLG